MGKVLSLIATVAIVAVFIYAFTAKPPIKLDANGFPIGPKVGDKFVKNGVTYTFGTLGWVATPKLPGDTAERAAADSGYGGVRVSRDTDINNRAPINKEDCLCGNGKIYTCIGYKNCSHCCKDDNYPDADPVGSTASRPINCPDWSNRTPIFTKPGQIGFENPPTLGVSKDCPPCVKFQGKVYTNFKGNNGFPGRCYYQL